MTNKMTSVRGRIRLNAATPSAGTSTMRISSVPYAEEEIPSGDSTPSASGLDSRCSPRSWLTSGGPSSLRLGEYQKVSGKLPLRSRRAVALRVATICAFRQSRSLFGRQRLHTTTRGMRVTCDGAPGCWSHLGRRGKSSPVERGFTRGYDHEVTYLSEPEEASHDDGGQRDHRAPVPAAQTAGGRPGRRVDRAGGRCRGPAPRHRLPPGHRAGGGGWRAGDLRADRPGEHVRGRSAGSV